MHSESVAALRLKRAFGWGLPFLLDSETSSVPELSAAPVSANSSGLAVKVHHAQDVDLVGFEPDDVIPHALVEVQVFVGLAAPVDVTYRGSVNLRSGVLTVGDPDHEDQIEVQPGRWEVQLMCAPNDDDADQVIMRLQRS